MKTKLFAMILFMACGLGIFIGLPQLKALLWQDTFETTRRGGPMTDEQKNLELEIAKVTDDSLHDRPTDIRYILKLPADPIRIEAMHRQRRTDSAEALPAGEPLLLQQFSMGLTARDKFRREPLPSARRQALTVGLTMLDIDKASLPSLSRNAILDFLDQHYMSIQARILRDPATDQWQLHHRPIALVAKYRNLPLTQEFNETLSKTVADMRGVGIFRPGGLNAELKTQTAVWLFRSDWMESGVSYTVPKFDYVFVHAIPENDDKSSPLRLHVIVTTNQRSAFHYVGERSQMQQPDRTGKVDVLGTIAITGYGRDGLNPSTSATRDVRINNAKHYPMADVEQYLRERGIEGGWNEALLDVLNGIVDGSLAPSREFANSANPTP